MLNSPALGGDVGVSCLQKPRCPLHLHCMSGLSPVAAGPAWETKLTQSHTRL